MTENHRPHRVERRRRPAPAVVHHEPVDPAAAVFEFQKRVAEASRRFDEQKGAAKPDPELALAELDVAWEELKTADEELRVQREELDLAVREVELGRGRYRELFDFAPEPYVVTDALGKIVEANRATVGLLNVPAYKLPGRFLISFVRLGDRIAVRERINEIARAQRPLRWECTLTPPSHREPSPEIAVAVTAAPGREGGILWTLRDVSEKRRQEAVLRAVNEDLERRVVERTSELEASRLAVERLLALEREARLQAERAGREREEFLALVSHELRSPLHAILGWAELAAEADDPAELRKALRVVEHNGRSMAALLDDLLDAARVERKALVLRREGVSLLGLLSALCDSLRPGAAARDVALGFEADGPSPCVVEGDPRRLEQVFTNLVVNALKFTPPGGRVSVRLSCDGGRALVRVSDTGQGIAPELLPHIFERYFQGEGGPQGAGRGLGLGLALARQVVLLHGGSVGAESEGEGKGSCFTVSLPVVASPPAGDAAGG